MMRKDFDIDIDFGDRTTALSLIKHIPAIITHNDKTTKHNTGIYVTNIPSGPDGNATIDYKTAEERGYFKFDFLNVSLYQQVKSEEHLDMLMATTPDWNKLYEQEVCEQLIHINNHYKTLLKMPERINSVERLAMFLSIIRPGKVHLIGKTWKEVAKTVWDKTDDAYSFKQSHAISYAHLVVIHLNLLTQPALPE